MTDFPHTHVQVDGRIHLVVSVEAHDDGPRHTHRVHLGCGLTVDADVGGRRHEHAADEHRSKAKDAGRRGAEAEKAIAEAHARSASVGARRHSEDRRWKKLDGTGADCPRCAEVEAGAAHEPQNLGHTAPRTVEADRATGIRCPSCSGEIRKRRSNGSFACTGGGHEFEAAELLALTQQSMLNLIELTKD